MSRFRSKWKDLEDAGEELVSKIVEDEEVEEPVGMKPVGKHATKSASSAASVSEKPDEEVDPQKESTRVSKEATEDPQKEPVVEACLVKLTELCTEQKDVTSRLVDTVGDHARRITGLEESVKKINERIDSAPESEPVTVPEPEPAMEPEPVTVAVPEPEHKPAHVAAAPEPEPESEEPTDESEPVIVAAPEPEHKPAHVAAPEPKPESGEPTDEFEPVIVAAPEPEHKPAHVAAPELGPGLDLDSGSVSTLESITKPYEYTIVLSGGGLGKTGPGLAYKFWDRVSQDWFYASDPATAEQYAADKWQQVHVWWERGRVTREMTLEEYRKYCLPRSR